MDARTDAPDGGPVPDEPAEPGAVPEPVSLETAASWLAAARPASVLALLRDPDFAFISMTAFAGFRVNPSGYALPLVRKRLAQEIARNALFAEKMRALAEEVQDRPPAPNSGGAGGDGTGTSLSPPELGAGGRSDTPSRREQEMKAERDRRRQERDEARDALSRSEVERTRAEAAREAADGARAEQARVVQQQAQRIARLERQVARMQTEQTSLLKALRQDKDVPPSPRPPAATETPAEASVILMSDAAVWVEAVSHLLNKGRHETALSLALDVLRADVENMEALDLAARAYEQKGMRRETAEMVRRMFLVWLGRVAVGPASEALMRLLAALPDAADGARDVRQWLPLLRTPGAVAQARAAAERLRVLSPTRHAWLAAEVHAAVPALAEELMPPPGALGPDDPLPLPGGWSARRLVEAVDANAEGVVAAARAALAGLDADSSARAWGALAQAADGDDSALSPLRRAPRGPAVVDGSNVAWFDQHSYAVPRARLRPIIALRRALRRRGYFPVLLYGDAPLPYTVDDVPGLRGMVGRGEIALVDSGVDADEVLLREAKRYQAPLVTNDYMTDWDPQNEVEKVRFTISLTGEAHLL